MTNSNLTPYKFDEKYNLAKLIWQKAQFGEINLTKSAIWQQEFDEKYNLAKLIWQKAQFSKKKFEGKYNLAKYLKLDKNILSYCTFLNKYLLNSTFCQIFLAKLYFSLILFRQIVLSVKFIPPNCFRQNVRRPLYSMHD